MVQAIEKVIAEGRPVDVVPLARAVGVSPSTLYRAIQRGEVAAITIGKRKTVPAAVARNLLQLPAA